MASIVIRNLEEQLKGRLRVRAAINGRSMEAEVREILRGVLGPEYAHSHGGAKVLRAQVLKPIHVELPQPLERGVVQEPPEFD